MRISLRLMVILMGGGLLLPASTSWVATAVQAADSQAITHKAVGKPLKDAQDAIKNGDLRAALASAKDADAVSGKTAYETYAVNEILAYIYSQQKDYPGVARAYEAELATGQVPAAEQANKIKTLAQLYYRAQDYSKAVSYADRYMREVGPDSEMQLLVAQASYIDKDYPAARRAAQAIIASAAAAGRKPDEGSLQLLLSSAFRMDDKVGIRDAMLKLVEYYPTPAYWNDLLTLLTQQSGSNPRSNLEVLRLREAVGALKDSDDFTEMAELALQAGLPGEAENVMQSGFSSRILGQGSSADRERRLLNMAKTQAGPDRASLGGGGSSADSMAATGDAYASYGDYDKAISLLSKAIAAGGGKDPDLTKLHLGQAYIGAHQYAEAHKAFSKVSQSGKYGDLARLWIVYADQKG